MMRLRTLGAVALERDGLPIDARYTQRRRLALLVLLACARRGTMSRDRILAQLWPERDAERSRHALAQLVYELRRDLGQGVIATHGDDLALDDTIISSDVAEFEDAVAQGAMERAAALYGGPFLDGFFVSGAAEFEHWAEERRGELAASHLDVLDALAVASTDRGDFVIAAEYRRRAAALDPMSTRRALALMQSLARAGDRAAAIHHAHLHARLLRGELDAEPDRSVVELAERLAREESGGPPTRIAGRNADRNLDADAGDIEQRSVPLAAPALPGPASAGSADILPAAARRRLLRFAPRRLGSAAIGLLAIAGAALLQAHRAGARVSTPRMLVLGEIASPDSVLSLAVREAVRAELERTPDVVVLSEGAVSSNLRLMELSPTARLTEAVADDVAQRGGVGLVVTGRAVPLASGVQVVVRLVDPQHGTTLASVSAAPRTPGEVVPAVARLAGELRERASRTPVGGASPMPAVTTSSLEALRDYALARAALARVDRQAALAYGEAAVAQDSDFALAHYLLGDLLWYVDRERHAEAHLERAYALRARLPVRERLLVRARYTQLVLDRPDSALAFWRELRAAYPAEPLGYEGAVWADLAVGRYDDAAAAADSALRLDSTAAPQVRNRMLALLALGDTTRALALTRTAGARWPYLQQQALLATFEMRDDWRGFQRALDSLAPPMSGGRPNLDHAPTRQVLLLSRGRVADARVYERLVIANLHAQFAIRALLFQAYGELAFGGSRDSARQLLGDAVARLDSTDLSPPATSRLAELAAGVAARTGGDPGLAAVAALRRIVAQRDAGRRLPSHELAQLTLGAAEASLHGDSDTAVKLLERTRPGRFFGRSPGVLALLEADVLERLGARARADSLYRLMITPGALHEDGDTWMVLRSIAALGWHNRWPDSVAPSP